MVNKDQLVHKVLVVTKDCAVSEDILETKVHPESVDPQEPKGLLETMEMKGKKVLLAFKDATVEME